MLTFVNDLFVLLAILASLTMFFMKNTYPYLRFFPIFLFIVGGVQGVGQYYSLHGKSNIVLYNMLIPFEFCFYLYTLHRIVKRPRVKAITLWAAPLFAVFAIINMLSVQKLHTFNSYSYAFGSLLIVALCVYIFFEFAQGNQPINVARQPSFWICAGLLFYYSCTFPFFGVINFMRSVPRVIINNLDTILNLLNIFLYSSFTLAFLCRIKGRSSTS